MGTILWGLASDGLHERHGDKRYVRHVPRKRLGHGGRLPRDGRDRVRHTLRPRPRGHLGVGAGVWPGNVINP